MDIFKEDKNKKIITLVFILIMLLALNYFRYDDAASKTFDNSVVKWRKDKWTGVIWLSGYAIDKTATRPVGYSGKDKDRVETISHVLTTAWYVLIVSDIALLIFAINKKE